MGEIWLGGKRLPIVQGFYTSRRALPRNPTGEPLLLSPLSHSGSHCHLWLDSTGILNQKLLRPQRTFPITSYLAIALGFPPGSRTPLEPPHRATAPKLSACPSSASGTDPAPEAGQSDMVILVPTAGFCRGYHTGSNSLSPHLQGVSVTCSPALPHGRDPRGQYGPSPCSEVWNRVSGMFVSLPATFAIFRELFGVGERSSALQSSTRSN